MNDQSWHVVLTIGDLEFTAAAFGYGFAAEAFAGGAMESGKVSGSRVEVVERQLTGPCVPYTRENLDDEARLDIARRCRLSGDMQARTWAEVLGRRGPSCG